MKKFRINRFIISTFIVCLIAFNAVAIAAEIIPLGTVQEVNGDEIAIMVESDRPAVAPEEIVTTQSRIPGIDEVVESAKGYIDSSTKDVLKVKITEGEPAIGDEVLLHKEQFLNLTLPQEQSKWQKMIFTDVRGRGTDKKEKNIGAMCAMANKYFTGEGVEKNVYDSFILSKYATTNFDGPPPDCASMYGWHRLMGDIEQPDSPRWNPSDAEGLRWVKYGAEKGSYSGMMGYGLFFVYKKEFDKAEIWFKKAMAIEPEDLKGGAQRMIDTMHDF